MYLISEYYCPNCNADLDDQFGFDSSNGTWPCTECGQFLMDDDIADGDDFEGVSWFCDNCNALLNDGCSGIRMDCGSGIIGGTSWCTVKQ